MPVSALATAAKAVYGISVEGGHIVEWSSLRNCVLHFTGDRNSNTKALELRIKYAQVYHGYWVSYSRPSS